MSDEKKSPDSEESKVDSYFDSLIDSFEPADGNNPDESGNAAERPITMRDFSKFFNDAAASGSGFESTIDNEPEEIANVSDSATISFSPVSEQNTSEKKNEEPVKEIITSPITDEDGMIVIFDEEAGIDATASASAISDISDKSADTTETEKNETEEAVQDTPPEENVSSEAADDDIKEGSSPDSSFSADSNISDESSENNISTDEKTIADAAEKKRSFIQGIIPWKGDSAGEVIRKIVFIASTGVFVAAAIMLISTLVQSQETIEYSDEIKEKVTTTVATSILENGETVTVPPTIEERESHAESVVNDFVSISGNVKGFLEMPACDIYLPVVQGTDNEYYLTHTYDDRKNKAGSIFIDYRCTISEEYTSPNLVLYGHNQEDGTMFGRLKLYKNNVDFYKRNPVFSFNTDYGVSDYVIFGYFVTNVFENQDSNGEVFHYHDYIETLGDEATFNWYIGEVNERNQIISPVDVAYGDKLMVLSTCSNEYSDSRFVILARKLRAGESAASFDFSTARLNPYAKQIDWDAILSQNSISTESETSETTVPTTETTTEPSVTEVITTTTEDTTASTTAETKQSDAVVSRLSLVPHMENGTTASIYTETEETTVIPDSETDPDNSDISDSSETETEETSKSKSTSPSLATQITTSKKRR